MAKKISKENTKDEAEDSAKDNTYVRARIDSETKTRAAAALESMGLSVSDAIRLLMLRIADEGCMPFDIRVPSKTTEEAAEVSEPPPAPKPRQFQSIQELIDDLNHAAD